MSKKKVLVLGIGQSNYILQLYGSIKNQLPEFDFSISGLVKLFDQTKIEEANSIFSQILQISAIKWSVFQKTAALLTVLTKKYIYKEAFLLAFDSSISIRKLKELILDDNLYAYLAASYINKQDYAIIHYHFITPRYTKTIKYLRKDLLVITTFWGSDLMRTTGYKNYYFQSMAMDRSRIISSATFDMGNIILSKYGRHLEDRIRYAKFIHDPKVYTLMDEYRHRADWQQDFKERYGIAAGNRIFIVGHNAIQANNHLKILECFSAMPLNEQAKVTCILPLAYSTDEKYLARLKAYCATLSFQVIYLEGYLSWDDLAKLKLIADAMVHMPVSDGLSAALTEYFYTGGLVLTASWLPYNTFSQLGLNYHMFDSFSDLRDFILENICEPQLIFEKDKNNIEIIRREFSNRKLAQAWENIFTELA